MNSGLIASRYGKAFLALADTHGSADSVYGQARLILSAMKKVEKFRLAITDAKAVSLDRKIGLLQACVAPAALQDEFRRLLVLMHGNGRTEFFRLALLDFLHLYRKERGIVMVQLTTAGALEEDMAPLFDELVRREGGKTAVINKAVNPDIIGGFICESWGYRIDASARRSLDIIKDELTETNRRLV